MLSGKDIIFVPRDKKTDCNFGLQNHYQTAKKVERKTRYIVRLFWKLLINKLPGGVCYSNLEILNWFTETAQKVLRVLIGNDYYNVLCFVEITGNFEDIFCSLLAQIFGEVDFQCHVLYRHSPHQSPRKQRILSFVLVSSTHSLFGRGTGNAYTVLYVHKHHAYVTPLSLCKYTLFQNVKSFVCVISALSFDKNNYHITHTVSRSAIIFQAEDRTG